MRSTIATAPSRRVSVGRTSSTTRSCSPASWKRKPFSWNGEARPEILRHGVGAGLRRLERLAFPEATDQLQESEFRTLCGPDVPVLPERVRVLPHLRIAEASAALRHAKPEVRRKHTDDFVGVPVELHRTTDRFAIGTEGIPPDRIRQHHLDPVRSSGRCRRPTSGTTPSISRKPPDAHPTST